MSVRAGSALPATLTTSNGGRRAAVPPLVLMVLVCGVFVAASWHHRAPIVYADEPGYLGNARWLVGGPPWSMGNASSYQVGYSLLIAPVFALVDTPANIYRAALLVNAVMCAALAGVLYVSARRILGASPTVAIAAAVTGCAYPALVVQSGIAWSETAAMLAVALLVLFAWELLRRPGYATMLASAALADYLSLLHNRFLALPILFLGLLAYVAVARRDLRVPALVSAGALAAAWILERALQQAVHRARWNAGAPTSGTSVHAVIRSIPGDLARSVTGQLWYLLVATAGLAALGVAALVWGFLSPRHVATAPALADRHRPLPARAVLTYVLFVFASVVVVSSVFTATGLGGRTAAPRIDYIAFGRYNDVLVPTLVAFAVGLVLVGLPRRGNGKVLGVAALATLVLGLGLVALEAQHTLGTAVDPARAPGIFAFVADTHGRLYSSSQLLLVTVAATALMLVLALLTRTRPWLVSLGVLCLFVAVGAIDVVSMAPTETTAAREIPLYQQLRDLHPGVVAYDVDHKPVLGFYGLPFWLNQSRFVGFRASSAAWPDAGLFVGPPSWPQAKLHGLHLLRTDPRLNQSFWVR